MATDPMANNNYLAVPQTGEKTAHGDATYGADELNPQESCCADMQPGPATPSIPVPAPGFNNSMQDTSGPH